MAMTNTAGKGDIELAQTGPAAPSDVEGELLSTVVGELERRMMNRVANGLSAFPGKSLHSHSPPGRAQGTQGSSFMQGVGASFIMTNPRRRPSSLRGYTSSRGRKMSEVQEGSREDRSSQGSVQSEEMKQGEAGLGGDRPRPHSFHNSLLGSGYSGETLDGSLILAMERTLFSALNQCWTLVMIGIGLMCVGATNDSVPDSLGVAIIVGGICFACLSYATHVSRLRSFYYGQGLGPGGSMLWTGSLMVLLVLGLACELHYALLYPYVDHYKH